MVSGGPIWHEERNTNRIALVQFGMQNRIPLVLFGMHNTTLIPCPAASRSILISAMDSGESPGQLPDDSTQPRRTPRLRY
jgi:hypothetical protein